MRPELTRLAPGVRLALGRVRLIAEIAIPGLVLELVVVAAVAAVLVPTGHLYLLELSLATCAHTETCELIYYNIFL